MTGQLASRAPAPDAEALVRCIRRAGTPRRVHHIELFLDANPIGKASVLIQNKQRHISVEHLATQPLAPARPKSSLDYLTALRSEYLEQQSKAAGPLQFTRLTPSEKDKPQEK